MQTKIVDVMFLTCNMHLLSESEVRIDADDKQKLGSLSLFITSNSISSRPSSPLWNGSGKRTRSKDYYPVVTNYNHQQEGISQKQ